jgi:hypothetical protein
MESVSECIKKMWHIYTTKYNTDIKKKEIMSFAGQWMEMEFMALSEISQSHKDKY